MSNKTVGPHKSSLGNLDANILALLSYLVASAFMFFGVLGYFAWIIPLIVFLMEKSSFVKFHAMQSVVVHAVSAVLGLLILIISSLVFAVSFYGGLAVTGLFTTLSLIINIVIAVFSIIAMIKAYQYTEYKIPVIAPIAAKLANVVSGMKTNPENNAAGAAPEQPAAEEKPADAENTDSDAGPGENS
jgi:uncharacterized membrane protein